jgi:hypothetical protein
MKALPSVSRAVYQGKLKFLSATNLPRLVLRGKHQYAILKIAKIRREDKLGAKNRRPVLAFIR